MKVRVAIVNDMVIAVEALRRTVASAPGYEVAWIARDGEDAVKKCVEDRPDILLMDLLMPVMDGVEATRQIMAKSPCAILVVTASVDGNISKVFEAMGAGALDAVCTPVLNFQGGMAGADRMLTKMRNIGTLLNRNTTIRAPSETRRLTRDPNLPPLVAIGASTGGPQAIAEILGALPADFAPAIVLVQHVDELFAPGLADYLNSNSRIKVEIIKRGSRPIGGKAWLASTNDNLIFKSDLTFDYTPEPKDYAYRPSVDVFFDSAGRFWPGNQIAVLLTGMGRDGAQGLLALKRHRWHTIAQDRATCVVYGMPKAAAEIDAASEILPLKQIGPRVRQLIDAQKGCRPDPPSQSK